MPDAAPQPLQGAVLVHGIGRTPASMLRLAARLRRLGIQPRLFGYVAALHDFDRIVARLTRRLEHAAAVPYLAIGHSLGGLLLRAAIDALPSGIRRPEHLYLLGTPNHAPRLAQRLHHWRLYRWVHGDCGNLLGNAARLEQLPRPDVPTTIVAGTRGWRGRWSPFGEEANDGLVTVSEASLDGVPLVTIPAIHTFLMNRREVLDLVSRNRERR